MLFSKAFSKGFTSKPGGEWFGVLGSRFLKISSIRVTSKCSLGFIVAATQMASSTLVFCFSSFSCFGSWSLDSFWIILIVVVHHCVNHFPLLLQASPCELSPFLYKTALVSQMFIITTIETVLILRFFWFVFPFSTNQ